MAGAAFHTGHSRQDWCTPPAFLNAVLRLINASAFEWDLAATSENRVAAKFFPPEMDSLQQNWLIIQDYAWLNPPFYRIEPWVKKAAQTDRDILVLVPASVGSQWWARWVHKVAAVYFIRPRLTFIGASAPYPKDCALLWYGHSPGYWLWNWETHQLS